MIKPSLSFGTTSLPEKIQFLSHPGSYEETTNVEVRETHMSYVFLTDDYVYKLKKPVKHNFLDFSTVSARHMYCVEELHVNEPLAAGIYLAAIPLCYCDGSFNLKGDGKVVDWLVKMKRLDETRSLLYAIENDTLKNEAVQKAATKLVDFYRSSHAEKIDHEQFRSDMMRDIESCSAMLMENQFKLHHSQIVGIATDLLHFIVKYGDGFNHRIDEGRVIDTHGDLKPDHIFLEEDPVIIDRLEFNKGLRVMDIAEELSYLSMECDMLGAHHVGQLFFNVYKWKSHDKVADDLVLFYKAKRAFLRAKLCIHHLLETRYWRDETKWRTQCENYLNFAEACCKQLIKAA